MATPQTPPEGGTTGVRYQIPGGMIVAEDAMVEDHMASHSAAVEQASVAAGQPTAVEAEDKKKGVPEEILKALPVMTFEEALEKATEPAPEENEGHCGHEPKKEADGVGCECENSAPRIPGLQIDSEELDRTCEICQCGYEPDDEVMFLPCKHFYHNECVKRWLEMRKTCPKCRHQVAPADKDDESTGRGVIVRRTTTIEWVPVVRWVPQTSTTVEVRSEIGSNIETVTTTTTRNTSIDPAQLAHATLPQATNHAHPLNIGQGQQGPQVNASNGNNAFSISMSALQQPPLRSAPGSNHSNTVTGPGPQPQPPQNANSSTIPNSNAIPNTTPPLPVTHSHSMPNVMPNPSPSLAYSISPPNTDSLPSAGPSPALSYSNAMPGNAVTSPVNIPHPRTYTQSNQRLSVVSPPHPTLQQQHSAPDLSRSRFSVLSNSPTLSPDMGQMRARSGSPRSQMVAFPPLGPSARMMMQNQTHTQQGVSRTLSGQAQHHRRISTGSEPPQHHHIVVVQMDMSPNVQPVNQMGSITPPLAPRGPLLGVSPVPPMTDPPIVTLSSL